MNRENLLAQAITRCGTRAIEPPKLSDSFRSQYSELVRDGSRPVIVANHQSHADGLPFFLLIDELQKIEPIEGFGVPLASTYGSGAQDKSLAWFFHTVESHFNSHQITFFPYTRDVDVRDYKAKINKAAELKAMREYAKGHTGFALLPEATVQGGRTDPQEQDRDLIFGMQELKDDGPNKRRDNIVFFLKRVQANNPGFFVIPLANNGTYHIVDQMGYRGFTREMLRRLHLPTKFKFRWQVFGALACLPVSKVATMTVGNIIQQEEILDIAGGGLKDNVDEVNRLVMGRIARLLPEQARGYYAQAAQRVY